MSDSSSASGPSNSATWTWVAVSGRRPSPKRTAGSGGPPAPVAAAMTGTPADASVTVSWPRRRAAAARRTRDRSGASWWRISSTVRGGQPAAAASAAEVSAWVRSRSSAARNPGSSARHAQDPRAVAPGQGVGDARPDAGVALAGVVEQPGEQDVRLGDAVGAQRGDDVEAVAPVGDVHRVEQRELWRGDPGRQRRPLLRAPRGPAGATGTGGPRRPPGSCRTHR